MGMFKDNTSFFWLWNFQIFTQQAGKNIFAELKGTLEKSKFKKRTDRSTEGTLKKNTFKFEHD